MSGDEGYPVFECTAAIIIRMMHRDSKVDHESRFNDSRRQGSREEEWKVSGELARQPDHRMSQARTIAAGYSLENGYKHSFGMSTDPMKKARC